MLFEEALTSFIGYSLICMAFALDGSPLTVASAIIAMWLIMSPVAGTKFFPPASCMDVFNGDRSTCDLGMEIFIFIAAAYSTWYFINIWKQSHPKHLENDVWTNSSWGLPASTHP